MTNTKSASISTNKLVEQNTNEIQQVGAIVLGDDEIRKAAYYKWEAEGSPCCDGVDFWLKAEAELIDSGKHLQSE